jgi:DNA polymerase III gamma/tau subunit
MLNWNQLLRPKSWDDVIAQKKVKSLIISSLENDNLGQFIIFSGQSGTGKSCIAELIGAAIACENSKSQPCGHCARCRALKDGDRSVVKKFNMATMIGKQDINSIITEVFNMESITEQSVYILEEVDALSEIQQRPFLEPLTSIPEDVTIIMCTAHYSNLIPELRNRAIHYRLDTPETSECVKFIKSVCRKMNTAEPDDETAILFADMCNNVPRTIISTLQMFANEENLTEEMLSSFFGIADTNVYIELAKNLARNVSESNYIHFLNSLETYNTDPKKIIKGLDRFIVMLLLQRDQTRPFKEYSKQQQEDLKGLYSVLSETDIIKLTELITDIPKKAFVDDNSAILFLIKLKLSLFNRENKILADNATQATQTKLAADRLAKSAMASEERRNSMQKMSNLDSSTLQLLTGEVYEE